MSDKNKNTVSNKESIEDKVEKTVENSKIEQVETDIHAEMSPKYDWGQIVNKSLGAIIVEYEDTTFSVPIKGISGIIRKDLIKRVSNSLYQWKKV